MPSTSKTSFDLIVVGGGPAGSAAACTAARQGLRVALLDQARFPRDKLCGGLLTLRAAKVYASVFDRGWDDTIEARAHGLRLFGRQGHLLNEVHDRQLLQFTCRSRFDHLLLQQAEAAGVQLHLGQRVRHINAGEAAVQLDDGRRFSARALIGADGVRSAVARGLFGRSFNPDTIALGLEMEVPREFEGADGVSAPEIHLGVARWGYGWIFPKRETLTVGLGGLLPHNPRLRQDFEAFVQRRFLGLPAARIKGHHIPYGDCLRTPGRDRVILCGDAAGLVEPITGEGIAFAMLSGREAALSVQEALGKSGSPLAAYLPRYRRLVADFRIARGLRQLMFPRACEALFLYALPRLRHAPARHMDLMADELGYPAYARYIAASVLTRGWRKLLPF
ncbi:NAD(P)/FAD-dependent oxidoreductase [Eleftheria terrae]|uniref:NAD(P)/FAD-dependent oxidoreductase n=1 Tax=Eleftheria terrae TaxID=1597781 RepID=UPI00263ADE81|nr:geranylgeranyl reductase family protein [Eleftheria terrae]WKB52428.1 geranylgeranyl reductase family protein [Eleftheria terrae]